MKRLNYSKLFKKGTAIVLVAAMSASVILSYDKAGQLFNSIRTVFADEVGDAEVSPAESEAPAEETTAAPVETTTIDGTTADKNETDVTEAKDETDFTEGGNTDPAESETTEPAQTESTETVSSEAIPSEPQNSESNNTGTKTAKPDIELKELRIKAEGEDIYVSGLLPADAKVTAEKVEVKVSGAKVIAAYDIRVFVKDGNEWQPVEPLKIEVASEKSNNVTKDETKVIYVPDEIAESGKPVDIKNKEIEKIDAEVKNGKVEFEAGHFSVYVIIEHEGGEVVTPRVEFHFIGTDTGSALVNGNTSYYAADPYEFYNKADDKQSTQILKNGENLELIADPANRSDNYFYGWYIVDPYVISGTTDQYGVGLSNDKLYFTWPGNPDRISFESPVSIDQTNVSIGSSVSWSLNGITKSGVVDEEGNIHVFLAPLYDNYHFVNFMLRPHNSSGSNNLMTRKLIALGTSSSVDVKISDIRSNSTDPVHLIFAGWEYQNTNGQWVTIQTVDYSGAPLNDPGRDGKYLNTNLQGADFIELYPVFIEARWVDFFSGNSGSGATYVASRFLESWGRATEANPPADVSGKNVFTSLSTSSRQGYNFDGWYAFAKLDQSTGDITNLDTAQPIEVSYLIIDNQNGDYIKHTITVTTSAVKVANSDGTINNCGTWSIIDNGDGTGSLVNDDSGSKLFQAADGKMRLYDALDRLSLSAKWAPDDSRVTVVYWTENVRDINYTAPDDPKDDYTANAVKVISTAELNAQSGNIGQSFTSGSSITLEQLGRYKEDSLEIFDRKYLKEIEAVLSGEEIFYDLNTELSDPSVTIKGDGSSIINVYFNRKEFTLVFHIGRDGYISTSGEQTSANNGSWLQMFYNDTIATGYDTDEGIIASGSRGESKAATATMTYNGVTYTNGYVTNSANVKNSYVPGDGENVYVIKAKYGAYIGDKWPVQTNSAFTFTLTGQNKELYTWSAYYGSRFAKLANDRRGSNQNWHPDINGVYSYMSAELCSDREGTSIINENQTHHLVAYYGEKNKAGIRKTYHILYEAIDGCYDPSSVTLISGEEYFNDYPRTTWTVNVANASPGILNGRSFYEVTNYIAISNLPPESQLASEIAGYRLIYSCYDTPSSNNYHIYFLYSPKQYTLTFNLGTSTQNDQYYYTQSLAEADKYTGNVVVPEGYYFDGWYTNSEGVGDPFDFANERMPGQNVVLYPILRVLQYTIKIDPNGGVIDHRINSSVSTYFTANYGIPIGEYSVVKEYSKLNDKELDPNDVTYYSGTKYYYINFQRLGIPSEGIWGLPTELRNAVYVSESDIDSFYSWYCEQINNADPSWWTGISLLSKEELISNYADYPYRPVSGEHYTFMGWYQVLENGTVSSMPYNFNDPVKGSLELRAMWRLDGGYYIQYNPYYFADDGSGNVTAIIGEVQQWTDPDDVTTQLYADQSPTHILRAPTNITSGWVFRGWRVVRESGEKTLTDGNTYKNWEPFGDLNYYQPGDPFTIDSALVTEINSTGKVIHMQAYYEKEEDTYRRPEVTNLTLDANPSYYGYVDPGAGTLPPFAGPGSAAVNTTGNLDTDGNPTQLLFGDIQSNLALRLYHYATTLTYNESRGTNFFVNKNNYLLLGFDENSDPMDPTTNKAYIPEFAPDSVAAVTRNDNKTLYAMWEPMIYVTFVNTTGADLVIDLSGTDISTISVVNEVTGMFDREKITASITVPAKSGGVNGRVKVVLPRAASGVDTLTAEAINSHSGYKISVAGVLGTSDHGTGSSDVSYSYTSTYSGILMTDSEGIVVTYTEEPEPTIMYNVNGGLWKETDDHYVNTVFNADLYTILKTDAELLNRYEPAEPVWSDDSRIFLGWTTNTDIASHTDFSSGTSVSWGDTVITPDTGSNVLEKIVDDYLWDFSQEPPYGQTLYAVWADSVTVTFDLIKSGSTNHTWSGPATVSESGNHVFYRSDNASPYVTYTMIKGEKIPKPQDPVNANWGFLRWVTQSGYEDKLSSLETITNADIEFDFEQRIYQDLTLFTSWISKDAIRKYTYTVRNDVIGGAADEEFEYVLTAYSTMNSSGTYYSSNPSFLPVTLYLKSNETYTLEITHIQYSQGWRHNSVYLTVTDRNGDVVCSGHMLEYHKNANMIENETSDYQMVLNVVQTPKDNYETDVTAQSGATIAIGEQTYTFATGKANNKNEYQVSTAADSFSFRSSNGNTNLVGTNENSGIQESNYPDVSDTIVFENRYSGTCYPAPTAVVRYDAPFAIMLVSALIFGSVLTLGKFRDREEAIVTESEESKRNIKKTALVKATAAMRYFKSTVCRIRKKGGRL